MYSVPSAGVLCVEPLEATKSLLDNTVVLPRSEVFQKFSIIISCLDWACPTEETYTLCGHMHIVISHVMIQTNTGHESQPVTAVDGEANFWPDLPMGDDTDWLDWLNNVN